MVGWLLRDVNRDCPSDTEKKHTHKLGGRNTETQEGILLKGGRNIIVVTNMQASDKNLWDFYNKIFSFEI